MSMPRLCIRQRTLGISKNYYVPFGLPLAAASLVIAFFWYRDRRPREGHCLHCGHNLTGNESGICPECGEPCKPDATAT